MNEKLRTFLIGLFVVIACLALGLSLFFLHPHVGDEGKIIKVRFTNIYGINVGTRVTFAGKPVGEVKAINEIYDARSNATDSYGQVYYYELELAIDSHVPVYDTDEIVLHTSGLLGEKSIAIMPRLTSKGETAHLVTDQVLYGKSGDPLEETMRQLATVGNKMGQTMDSVTNLINSNSAEIHQTIQSVHDSFFHLDQLFQQALSLKIVATVKDAAAHFGSLSFKGDRLVGQLNQKNFGQSFGAFMTHAASITEALDQPPLWKDTLNNIHGLSFDIRNTVHNAEYITDKGKAIADRVEELSQNLAGGKGTLGKLINSQELYSHVMAVISRIEALIDNVSNYGLLFHLNKKWQRGASERTPLPLVSEAQTTPQDSFQKELEEICLALNRVSELLCKDQPEGNVDQKTALDGLNQLMEHVQQMECQLQENCSQGN